MTTVLTERAAAAWVDLRSAPCFHHALLLQRAELRTAPGTDLGTDLATDLGTDLGTAPGARDDPTADPILQAVLVALAEVRLDDEARALGLRSDHVAAIRFALAALLDECAAHQPGSERWRERLFDRAGLPRSANVGHEFFAALESRLTLPAPSPADLAVLQVHAVCLLLGLRGRYGADVTAAESELEHQLRRLHLKLRPLLGARLPPSAPPPPIRRTSGPSRTSLRIAGLLLVFTVALAVALRAQIEHHADILRSRLAADR